MEVKTSIDGLLFVPLKCVKDDRGMVMHMLSNKSSYFKMFGEVYFSYTNPWVIKGWKKHLRMVQNFAVPVGLMKFVFFDPRSDSPTFGGYAEIVTGLNHNYGLVQVPHEIWYSFQSISDTPALITNCATIAHDPSEVEVRPLDDPLFAYRWDSVPTKNGASMRAEACD